MTIGTFRQVIPLLSPPLSPILLPIFHVYILYPHVYTPFILPIYCMCHQQMTSCPLETLAEALIAHSDGLHKVHRKGEAVACVREAYDMLFSAHGPYHELTIGDQNPLDPLSHGLTP